MTLGQTLYSDITTLVNDIYEDAFYTLRADNLLVRTVTVLRAGGMAPRNVTEYGEANPREVAEGADVTPTKFERELLNTLSPARHADQFFLSDQRMATDPESVRDDAASELGASFANYVDTKIATNFSQLTGGTIGSAGGTLTWASILRARATMQNNKIPGPYWCALHPFQWERLVEAATINGTEISDAPNFQDALVSSYFISSTLGGVTFVISPNIAVSSNNATGAMYARSAIAFDERKAFNIRPQRDESREGVELNASLWFAHGKWRPIAGVQLVGLATLPS